MDRLSEGWLTRTEVLALYAYGHLASKVKRSLASRTSELRVALGVSEEFAERCDKLWAAKLSKLSNLTLERLLDDTPAEVSKAVFKLVMAERMQRQHRLRTRLPGLEAIAYQHPGDRAALSVLAAVPVLPALMAKVVDFLKTAEQVNLMGSAVAVTPQSLPPVYDCFCEACEVLQVRPMPPLFVEEGPVGAYTTGAETPFVVLTSAAVSLLTREELLFVLGHELGHIQAAHVKYQSLVRVIRYAGVGAAALTHGLSLLASEVALAPALARWSRRSEFTGDRAGLLACQDKEVALRTLFKLAGYPVGHYGRLHPRFIVAQAEAFRSQMAESFCSRMMSVSNLWQGSHPYTILRAYELLDWTQDGTAEDLLQADPGGRRELAALVESDPHLAELRLVTMQAIGEWASATLHLPRNQARRTLRQMIDQGAAAQGTPLEPILQIQLSMEKAGADQIHYQAHLLVNIAGKPTRVRLPVAYESSWDYAPLSLRKEFIHSGQRELVRELYSVR